ncbi:PorV/PorQ family protein [bacterium]|nr:PorV/PorQ family protein [bacterium]
MKKFLTLFFSVMLISMAFAGTGAGTTGAPFLKIPVGAKAGALGEAIVAAPLGGEAVYWNLGSLAFQKGIHFNASYQVWIADISSQFVGLSYNLGDMGTLGLGFVNLGSGEIDKTTILNPDGTDLGTFTATDMAVTLGYGKKLGDNLGIGIGAKYVSQKIDTESATAFTADLGIRYKVMDNLCIGVSAQNLFGQIGFTEKFNLPTMVKAGVAFKPMNNLLVLAAGDYNLDSGIKFGGGLQYTLMEMVALRLGYGGGQDNNNIEGFTAGFGVNFKMVNVDFSYALSNEDAFKDIMKFSLGLQF